MIREAKGLLERIIQEAIPGITVVRSAADEQRQVMGRKFPLVALITNPGTFDESEAKTVRYVHEGQYIEIYVRGYRTLPILIRCWADGEDKADVLMSAIIPKIPSQWEHNDFALPVKIGSEEHSDHAGNTSKMYLSVVEVTFAAAAVTLPGQALPSIESTEIEMDE